MNRAGAKQLFDKFAAVWRSKSQRYWLTAALVLAVTLYATPWVNERLGLDNIRYSLFQFSGALGPRPLRQGFSMVVGIDDHDFIVDSGGMTPVSRAYIARIVDSLNKADAHVIALDFILRYADGRMKPVKVGDFSSVGDKKEVDALIKAVIAAADNDKKIVLPIDILPNDDAIDSYKIVPAIYQAYGLCTSLRANGVWDSTGAPGFVLSQKARRNINCGYIELPYDPRQVPPLINIKQKWRIASFSLAIAAVKSPQAAEAVGSSTKFVAYLPTSKDDPVTTAGQLLRKDPSALDAVQCNVVIVGGRWHRQPAQEMVDLHDTPLGKMSGLLMHENFAEGILDARLLGVIPDWAQWAIDVFLGIAFAFVFAAFSEFWTKLLLLAGIAVGLFLVQWLLLTLFGSFLEVFLPLLGLSLHSILEKLLE